jgi:4,5-DOPA dioxygenase extradiol
MITKMPVVFVGHGSPMNAIEDNRFSREWEKLGNDLPRPKAVLCISAHWETETPKVTAMEQPRTIHDFGGFPRELFEKQYPAPGNLELVKSIIKRVKNPEVSPDLQWGLDHGTWSVLCRMYPAADIPVTQLSLAYTRDGDFHYNIGRQLNFLRKEGVMILGSGNIVHNLMRINWDGEPFDWASEFDSNARQWIMEGAHAPLIEFQTHGQTSGLAVNSGEHYLPLLYVLGASEAGEPVKFFNEGIFAGSISMRGLVIG